MKDPPRRAQRTRSDEVKQESDEVMKESDKEMKNK
jgi:hypothetical protein